MNSPWLVALPSGSCWKVNRKTRGFFTYWKDPSCSSLHV
jgi:hypothetical protein